MRFKETRIVGSYEIDLAPLEDERGFFMRTYDKQSFEDLGLATNWVQESHSLSRKKGTLRGLHFQLPPHSEAKIVRCTAGKIFDVFVDLRKGSPSFGKFYSAVLSAETKNSLYLPKGTAHGFCTLTDDCEVLYKMDVGYCPEKYMAINWKSPSLDIAWPINDPIISPKDSNAMSFQDFIKSYGALEV
jgi:dTDP-4-dehydrorhamnose 3,5-epimerase